MLGDRDSSKQFRVIFGAGVCLIGKRFALGFERSMMVRSELYRWHEDLTQFSDFLVSAERERSKRI